MTRNLYLPAIGIAAFLVLMFVISPFSARAQGSPWDSVIIEPESGNWNYPGYFIVTATVDVTLSWEIKCTEGGCFGRQAEFVHDYFLAAGESVRVGWGDQCYRWQFDPIDWDHGYIAEPDPEVCASLTATPEMPTPTATPETPTSTPDTATPTSTETLVTTPPTTPETATPTSTGTLVTTPPTTPGTATPTSTGTLVTTPPATPGTATITPTATETPSTPNQAPTETPRSQLIAVTGADLSGPSHLSRLVVSLAVVLLGLGLVRLGVTRKSRR